MKIYELVQASSCRRNTISLRSAAIATTWDLYDSLVSADHHEAVSIHDLELVDFSEAAADISKTTDLSFSLSSTASSGSEPGNVAPLNASINDSKMYIHMDFLIGVIKSSISQKLCLLSN